MQPLCAIHASDNHSRLELLFSGLLWLLLSLGAAQGAGLRVEGLKCEYGVEPLGLETPQPRLSWRLEAGERGQVQTAYQVLAALAPGKLAPGKADLWDSGQVASSESIQVVYEGLPLRSGQRVYWKVRAWDKDGRPSSFSRPAWWEMGLLATEDWRACWITRRRPQPQSEAERFGDDPAPLMRKEFSFDKKVSRARVYVSGLGYYELYLNGARVGDRVLDPGWTSYAKRVLYSTYDVTEQLKRGSNALGLMLGNGWFDPLPLRMWGQLNLREHLTVGEPRAIAQLVVEFTDGTAQRIVTDTSWKTAAGPMLRNSVYLGEVYDARKELRGWDRPGFDDTHWEPAATAEPLGPLRAQTAPPIRITRTLQPVKITEPKPGIYIFDLGQNFAGWVRLRVHGAAGARLKLRYGELLYPEGTLNGMTSVCGQIKQGDRDYRYDGAGAPRTAFQQDEYILKGEGEETYTPRFTFHGFRYVEVTAVGARTFLSARPPAKPLADRNVRAPGAAGKVCITKLEGLRLNADVTPAGTFACSNERFNRIQQMVLWTELSNLFSVQSDCPHREKFGYGGDIVAASEMAMFNFDMSSFYAKTVRDLADAVRPNGGFTETAPFVGLSSDGLGGEAGPIGWGTAHPLLQWQLYQYYGERRLLEEQYPATQRWLTLLQSCARDGILDNGISDHESLVPKPRALTGTAFYYLNARLAAQIARELGHQADADADAALAETIKAAFNRRFLQPGTGRYDAGSQACQAFALYLGLVPPEEQERAGEVLARDIVETHQGHLTTGIFGSKFMLNALTGLGRADVAYEMVNQRTFPGWGQMLEAGATTLWEHWEFSDNTYSHNHPMFGSVSEWFYKALAGISPAPGAVGFDKILIAPQLAGDLKWVKADHDSIRGKIVSDWSRAGDQFKLRVRVPVGATATVLLPAKANAAVAESGRPLEKAVGVKVLGAEKGRVAVGIGAGDYVFTSVVP